MIKKPAEMINETNRFRVLIAGYPGIGKTTLGLSAPKPLLIDVDFGINRVMASARKDYIQPNTYDELLKAETNTIVFELFKNYIIKRHNNITIDENEILFLFNRYNVTFKSDFVKLDITLSNKLYTLKYIFSLK